MLLIQRHTRVQAHWKHRESLHAKVMQPNLNFTFMLKQLLTPKIGENHQKAAFEFVQEKDFLTAVDELLSSATVITNRLLNISSI